MASLATGNAGKPPPCASPPACRGMKFSRRSQGRGVGVDGGALRWPWGGGSGEAQLGLGSGGREGWGLGAETLLEDPARDERVGEGGDAVAAAAARGAAQHVHREGPLEEFGPALALWFGAGLSFGLGLADAWRGTGPGGGDGAAGDDGIAQGRGGGEDAEVGPLVLARVGDQGDEGGVVRDGCYDSALVPQWPYGTDSLPQGACEQTASNWKFVLQDK